MVTPQITNNIDNWPSSKERPIDGIEPNYNREPLLPSINQTQ